MQKESGAIAAGPLRGQECPRPQTAFRYFTMRPMETVEM